MEQGNHMTFQTQQVLWSCKALDISAAKSWVLWLLAVDFVSLSYDWIIHSRADMKNKIHIHNLELLTP